MTACEKVIADGQATGKDLGLAYQRRAARRCMNKRDYDKAIAAFDAAHAADPDDAGYHQWSRHRL